MHVHIPNLLSSIKNASAFELPKMSTGTKYIHDNVYMRFINDKDIRISGLNFNAFETDDIEAIVDLVIGDFNNSNQRFYEITNALRQTPPICKDVVYV